MPTIVFFQNSTDQAREDANGEGNGLECRAPMLKKTRRFKNGPRSTKGHVRRSFLGNLTDTAVV